MPNRIFLFIFSVLLLFCNIKKDSRLLSVLPLSNKNLPSSSKEITSFSFQGISPPVTAVISGNLITANLLSTVSLSSLSATFETTGTQVLVNNTVQVSGVTVNDYSSDLSYTVTAEDGTTNTYTVRLSNTGNFVLGSSGVVNITGLSASDSPLVLYYDSSGTTFQSYASNTKIGVVLPSGTAFAMGVKTQPTGKVCSFSSGATSGTLTADSAFTINCVGGYLVGGKVLPTLATFTIPANGAIVVTISGSFPPTPASGTADGVSSAGRYSTPLGVTYDGSNFYISDTSNHCIRKYVASTSSLTTFAGNCGTSGTTDATGTSARFSSPMFLTTDGTNLYICDRGNNSIRKIVIATGVVTTFAGLTGTAGDLDGTGTAARLNFPNGVTNDGTYLYVSDRGNQKIKRVALSTGVVETIAGSGTASSVDGNGTSATFNVPCDSIVAGSYLYVVECTGNRVRRVGLSSPFTVTTIAGSGTAASTDGVGTAAEFNNPHGIGTDGSNLFITEWNGQTIRRLNIASNTVYTIAGGVAGFADGTGTGANMRKLGAMTSDGSRLYFMDSTNHAFRKIDNTPD